MEHIHPGGDVPLDPHLQNAALPVDRLPVEIVLECVRACLFLWPPDNSTTRYRQLYTLSGVCSRWRRMINETPSLWSYLDHCQTAQHLDLCLSRSGTHPLGVLFSLSQSSVQKFTTCILPHLPLCSSFQLSFAEESPEITTAFTAFLNTHMPLLTFLDIVDGNHALPPIDVFNMHPEAPCQKISISFWPRISLLSRPPSTLLQLSLVAIQYDTEGLSLSKLVDVLRQSPNLNHLELSFIKLQQDNETCSEVIPMPSLKYLHVEQECWFYLFFLRRVSMPGLRACRIKHSIRSADHDCHDLEQLEGLMGPLVARAIGLNSSFSLQMNVVIRDTFELKVDDGPTTLIHVCLPLSIRQGDVKPSLNWIRQITSESRELPLHLTFFAFPKRFVDTAFLDALANFPRVESIIVHRCSDAGGLLTLLAIPRIDGAGVQKWVVPHLRRLSLCSGSYSDDEVTQMIRNRYQTNSLPACSPVVLNLSNARESLVKALKEIMGERGTVDTFWTH